MPRNSSGSMAPANGPYISGTTISTVAVNARFADIETELGDSLSRSGKGGMTAVLRGADGTVAAPAYSFTSEVGTGIYKAAAGDVRVSLSGTDAVQLTSNGLTLSVTQVTQIKSATANGQLVLGGNRNAADGGIDVSVGSAVPRTAGYLFAVQSPMGGLGGAQNKLLVDYQGLLMLNTPAAAIQPATLWTAIVPNTGYTASNGLAYWKDAGGVVHLKGSAVSNGTGTATVFTLPVGFRPSVIRTFMVSDDTGSGLIKCTVSATGAVSNASGVVIPNGNSLIVDPVSFLAEQ